MQRPSPKDTIILEKEMSTYQGSDKIISSHDLYTELAKTSAAVYSIETGIPTLDRVLEKFELGELIIVTGPTGEGKTTLCMTVTQNMASKGVQTLWFTLEVTPRQFIKKIMGNTTDVTKLPLFYLPAENTDNTIDWIEKKIIEAKVKHDVKVIFIDHIHQIFSLDRLKYGNVSLELGDMVAKVKDMAIRYNLIIVLIAHTKDDPQKPNSEPGKESIRDSGLISRLADSIIAVWRVPEMKSVGDSLASKSRGPLKETDTWSKVRVLKNRRLGMHGTCVMKHTGHRLEELPPNFVEPTALDKEMDDYGT